MFLITEYINSCYVSNFYLIFFFSTGTIPCQAIYKCKRAFQALISIAIEELCEIANSLIAPVRMGVARPTAPFNQLSASIEAIQVGGCPLLCCHI